MASQNTKFKIVAFKTVDAIPHEYKLIEGTDRYDIGSKRSRGHDTLESMLNSYDWSSVRAQTLTIHRVRREVDGEEFTVGQTIHHKSNSFRTKILRFERIGEDIMTVWYKNSAGLEDITNIINIVKVDNINDIQTTTDNNFTLKEIEVILSEVLDKPELKETIKLFRNFQKKKLTVADGTSTQKAFVMPEKWCIKPRNFEEAIVIFPYNNKIGIHKCRYDEGDPSHYKYYSVFTYKDGIVSFYDSMLEVPEDCTEIDFETFKNHIAVNPSDDKLAAKKKTLI